MNILIIILLVFLVAAGIQAFLQRAPKYGPGFLKRVGLLVLVLAIVLLALGGRLPWIFGMLAALLPFMKRILPLVLPLLLRMLPFLQQTLRQRQTAPGNSGQHTEISTRFLKMTLDHDSGNISGEVIAGPYQGRTLQQLGIEELADLYQQCQRQDGEGVRLLETYIQRHCSEQWQQWQATQGAQSGDHNSTEMSLQEAWEILGLSPGSSREEVLKAHKRMIARMHPDKGGSNYLASKINQAKELLLQALKH